jgi:hypothetical protein
MHGLQARRGGDGQAAFRLVAIDSFGDYVVARKTVIASKLGERAQAWRQPNKLHSRSALFTGARMLVRGNIAAHAERILHPPDDRQRRHRRPPNLQHLYELQDHAMALARNEASGLWRDYGCDEQRERWWACDERGRRIGLLLRGPDHRRCDMRRHSYAAP